MKNRILSLILALLLVLTLVPAAAFADGEELSGECGENVTWKLEDGVLTISGTGPMQDFGWTTEQPWYSAEYDIKSIVVGEGITTIGNSAFQLCGNVSSVSLPETLTRIGGYAFSGCSQLKELSIPDGVTSIGGGAFSQCNFTGIELPSGLKELGPDAFLNCGWLEKITIPSGVVSLETGTFKWCTSLESVELPNGMTSIGGDAFCGCKALKSIAIPDSVTSIGEYAFEWCMALESVEMPSSLTDISQYAFHSCRSLKEIYFPSSLKTVNVTSFVDCGALESIYYGGSLREWKEKVTFTGEYPYDSYDNDRLVNAAVYFADESDPFTDIDCAFHDYIVAGYAADIINGYPDNTFRPYRSVTRAQFITMLYNMCGSPDVSGYGYLAFKDASSISSAYEDAVLWGCLSGIVSGYGDGTFRPNDSISRAQMATFAYRLLKELVGEDVVSQYNTDSNFTDSDSIANSYREAVNVMSTLEIINGYEDGSFRPNATATRGASAKIIVSVYIAAAAMLEQ